ncbi:GDP-mannose 4,6-dehydratase [Mucilaginibacter lappiensis]|jgi:UDP-glucose 4-epimerase|uniref:GDP-mannose 4,6-dehydratase n=1 Tax=Mucilaginibacter lappiensis TaxID=354630 RepID=UPI003D21E191
MNKTDQILVTGGNGFIGSHIIDFLINNGYTSVISLDNLSGSNYGNNLNVNPQCKYVYGDLGNLAFLDKFFSDNQISYIFHIGANGNVPYSNDFPTVDFNSNAAGTFNIFNLSLKYKIKKVVFASTAAVYGVPESTPVSENNPLNPVSNYGLTKLYGEKLAIAYYHTYGLNCNVIRIFNTYGPRQPRYVLYDFIKKLNANKTQLEVFGDGEQVRDYAYVSDTVKAFYDVMLSEKNGEVYNISGGNPINLKQLIVIISEILKIDPVITYTGKSWPGDIKILNGDISKIKREIGFEPKVSIKQGLEKSIEWFKENNYISVS